MTGRWMLQNPYLSIAADVFGSQNEYSNSAHYNYKILLAFLNLSKG